MLIAALFIFVCLMAGVVGSFFTMQSIPTWYAGLNKPAFNPPNWVFGPVWTGLYVLMGISAYLVYSKGAKKKEVRTALMVFSAQLLLNAVWSILFFGLQSLLYGLVGIVALWLSIAATMWRFYGISREAAWLLAPYMLWVSFAGVLNYFIWTLN